MVDLDSSNSQTVLLISLCALLVVITVFSLEIIVVFIYTGPPRLCLF